MQKNEKREECDDCFIIRKVHLCLCLSPGEIHRTLLLQPDWNLSGNIRISQRQRKHENLMHTTHKILDCSTSSKGCQAQIMSFCLRWVW